MITYKIHLIHHGAVDENLNGLYIGRLDPPLGASGRAKLVRLRKEYSYPEVQKVYTGPLSRCRETAELLYPDRWTQTEEALNECDFGEFTGKSIVELKEDPRFLQWMKGGFSVAPPGGESGEALLSRTVSGLDAIFRDMMRQKISSAAAVTHGGVIMSLLSACGFPKREMKEWLTGPGRGFTLLFTPELWMRDRVFEIHAELPYQNCDAKFTDELGVLDGSYFGWEEDGEPSLRR
ncbi:MAG: histidine phosphatase family protein [Oscillospiraceae bacterium]|nr:histidine phosphatase family protein [Oscillospiraceae bacterium]